MSWRDRVARELVQRHGRLRAVLPRGHRAYPAAGGWTYLDVRESPMMLARALRAYESGKTAALRSALRPGMVFVDVGGNKGDFALIAAKAMGSTGRIVCVEPEPVNAAWIRKSVGRNGYTNVEIEQVALADRDGDDTLFLGPKSGWHTLVEDPSLVVATLTVPIRTLDSLLAERGIEKVDVIKIDVEGAEGRVLAGAGQTLGGDNPMTLLIDLHPKRVDTLAVCEQLRSWDFTFNVDPTETTKEVVATRP
ncbi:MAG: FkbM family methyltransferase [Acidimicrobiales bacterium]|nr:FkbM family methyltransferase [Acidimicrobiales bacterium]